MVDASLSPKLFDALHHCVRVTQFVNLNKPRGNSTARQDLIMNVKLVLVVRRAVDLHRIRTVARRQNQPVFAGIVHGQVREDALVRCAAVQTQDIIDNRKPTLVRILASSAWSAA